MGCASSSPLVNGGGPGGLVDSAKTAGTDIMHTGETAMNEMGEKITETVGQMKDTIVESVNGVTDMINDGITKIPLKDTMESTNHMLEENLENLKNDMLTKTQSITDDTDKMADQLMQETEDVIRDAETGMVDMQTNAVDTIESMKNELMETMNGKSPTHSIDSLKTSVPEPEIERLLNGVSEHPATPERTLDELAELNKESIPETSSEAEMTIIENNTEVPSTVESNDVPETPAMKSEEEMVVEDVKSTDEDRSRSTKPIGIKLTKSQAVHETSSLDASSDDDDFDFDAKVGDVEDDAPKTQWEELQDIYFEKRFSRARNASQESLLEDEDACQINLSHMYQENGNTASDDKSSIIPKVPSKDSIDAIDELIKSFEKETIKETENEPAVDVE